ncbi:MAG: glycosyltransferase, partial [Acidimicrobiales bacterium]|nr:glycosyltransferase [Acidimicrobiales bacterium]
MSTPAVLEGRPEPDLAAPPVEIVVPVYNEEHDLEPSVRRLRRFLDERFPIPTIVIIADNASTDRTWEIASELQRTVPGVRAVHLDEKGRGRAVKHVWSGSSAR